MPPKAKPKAGGGGGKIDEEAWDNFKQVLTKNAKLYKVGGEAAHPSNQILNMEKAVPDFHKIVTNAEDPQEDATNPECFNFSKEYDHMAFNVLFNSLRQAEYKKVRAVRLWKCDQKVRLC